MAAAAAASPSDRSSGDGDGSCSFGGYLPEGEEGAKIVDSMRMSCRSDLMKNAEGKDANLDGNAWSEKQAEADGKGVVQSAATKAGVTSWRCQMTMDYPPAVLKEAISPVNRVKWDTQVRSIDEKHWIPVGDDSVTCALTVYSVNGALVISARDFCDLSFHETLEDGSVLLYGRSIETEKYPPQSGYVRAENLAGGGWVIRPTPGDKAGDPAKSRCTYMIVSDLKGWLPAWAVDQAIVGTYNTFFAELRKFLDTTDEGKAI